MKKIFFITFITMLFLLICLIGVLSTTGYETKKFNSIISSKINDRDPNILLKLKKIRFKLDIKDASLFLETIDPELDYQNLSIPVKDVKVYLDFISLIKSQLKINRINISSRKIDIEKLKKIIIKTKPSNLNSLIINKVTNGQLTTNLEIYFKNNLEVDNFIAKGKVSEMNAAFNNDITLKNASFTFFADTSDVLIKNIKSDTDGILIQNGNLQIERSKGIVVKSDFITKININENNIKKYSKFFKNKKHFYRDININGNLSHNLNVSFDRTFKVINHIYNSKGKIDKLTFKLDKSIQNPFSENNINNFKFKDFDFSYQFKEDKKNYISALGKYKINDYDYQNFNLQTNFFGTSLNTEINFDFAEKLNLNLINYKKEEKKVAKISSNFSIQKDSVYFKKINYEENKNLISIDKLKISKNNLVSLKKIKVITYNKNEIKNDFSLNFGKKKLSHKTKSIFITFFEIYFRKSLWG